jgi:hypothetical protein
MILSLELILIRHLTVKKAYRTSFYLLRSLKSKNPQFLVNMFKINVIPILEFVCPIFIPYYFKDIDSIEKDQRKYTFEKVQRN